MISCLNDRIVYAGKGDEHVSREQLADQILGMLPLIHRKLLKKYKSNEFKRNEFLLLHHLRKADGQPMHEYGKKLCISKPNLTKLVGELEKKQWVRKEQSRDDKRVIHIYITEEGEACLKKQYRKMKERVLESTDRLTDEEVETLVDNFQTIHAILSKLNDRDDLTE